MYRPGIYDQKLKQGQKQKCVTETHRTLQQAGRQHRHARDRPLPDHIGQLLFLSAHSQTQHVHLASRRRAVSAQIRRVAFVTGQQIFVTRRSLPERVCVFLNYLWPVTLEPRQGTNRLVRSLGHRQRTGVQQP